jgi:hypothetical protein
VISRMAEDKEREGMPKCAENKERKQQRGTSEEGTNEMVEERKTRIREIREDTAGIREENKVLRKELGAVREKMRGREEKSQAEEAVWMKMIKEKMEQR